MKRANKYIYLHVVQGNYAGYGWEDLDEDESYSVSRYNLKEYRIACPDSAHRMIKRRELNPERSDSPESIGA